MSEQRSRVYSVLKYIYFDKQFNFVEHLQQPFLALLQKLYALKCLYIHGPVWICLSHSRLEQKEVYLHKMLMFLYQTLIYSCLENSVLWKGKHLLHEVIYASQKTKTHMWAAVIRRCQQHLIIAVAIHDELGKSLCMFFMLWTDIVFQNWFAKRWRSLNLPAFFFFFYINKSS